MKYKIRSTPKCKSEKYSIAATRVEGKDSNCNKAILDVTSPDGDDDVMTQRRNTAAPHVFLEPSRRYLRTKVLDVAKLFGRQWLRDGCC